MSVTYERDDAARQVSVTVHGPFQTSDMLAVIERQRAEGTWSYGVLFDLRLMTGRPSLVDLREIMGQAASHRPSEGLRGPVAILVTEPVLYGIACTYAAMGQSRLTINVFRDRDEANQWLAAKAHS